MPFENFYPHPIVPQYLKKHTIKNLPLDMPFYVLPGDFGDSDRLNVFLDDEDRLRVNGEGYICPSDRNPDRLMGRVGLMRIIVTDTSEVQEVILADLRFIPDYTLLSINGVTEYCDSEELPAWQNILERSSIVSGFIAPESNSDLKTATEKDVFYGPEYLQEGLHYLEEYGDDINDRNARRKKKNQLKKQATKKQVKINDAVLQSRSSPS